MASGIRLKKGKLSVALLRAFHNYYRIVDGAPRYTRKKWKQWMDNPEITRYLAKDGKNNTIGWIIFNPEKSTIEEILVSEEYKGKGLESKMLDALIVRENLVAAEILSLDREKYRWMEEYGFRPTRRFSADGFSFLKMDLSTAVLLRKLEGCEPAKSYRKKERVAIERVPDSQTHEEIKKGLKNLIKRLGGLNKFIKPGQTVVIKPNIVSEHGLKDGVYKGGIVTDVRLIKALVELLLLIAGKVIIAEGSSINRSETGKMFTHYGYDRLIDLDPRKVSLVDLNTEAQVEKQVPGGKRMLSRKIPVTLERADVIISVPVLKIHFAAIVSLSIKNLQGAIPPLEKYMSHFFGLWQNLINIHHLVKPKLIIVDGLTGQEDFGPISGTPKKMNLLIGGINPVAVDSVAMRIMGLDPATSPPVWLAYMQGIGPIATDRIRVIGPPLKKVVSPFKQPEINLKSGRDIAIHVGEACPGCKGYLHFVLNKLRRPDSLDPTRHLIDRPFDRKVNIFLGPAVEVKINPEEINIFMGICQQHHAEMGTHLPGCPPHAEVILKGIFSLFPDIERPKYADKSEEDKLGEMLQEILAMA
jgi:uncharacterized protein (DUF362 family)